MHGRRARARARRRRPPRGRPRPPAAVSSCYYAAIMVGNGTTNFQSDNVTACCPEVMAAVLRANLEAAVNSYGGTVGGTLDDPDPSTAKIQRLFAEVFETTEIEVFPVATGTAANMLALATVTPPWGVIYSPGGSHAASDECNAPESATGGAQFVAAPSVEGKVDAELLDDIVAVDKERSTKYFHSLPSTISITNITEAGTSYSAAETAAIGRVAKRHDLVLHLDGARFGNAVAATGACSHASCCCTPHIMPCPYNCGSVEVVGVTASICTQEPPLRS
jgi:threonine aldolase